MAELEPRQNRVFGLYRGLLVILDFSGNCSEKALWRPIQVVLTLSFEKSDQLRLERWVLSPIWRLRKNPAKNHQKSVFFEPVEHAENLKISKNENFFQIFSKPQIRVFC